jgi:hypothetical protein
MVINHREFLMFEMRVEQHQLLRIILNHVEVYHSKLRKRKYLIRLNSFLRTRSRANLRLTSDFVFSCLALYNSSRNSARRPSNLSFSLLIIIAPSYRPASD